MALITLIGQREKLSRDDLTAMMLAGENPGSNVVVPPTLITQAFLNENDIKNMEDFIFTLDKTNIRAN